MNNYLVLGITFLALVGCDRNDKASNHPPAAHDNDNTAKNVRDREWNTKTPPDQSETEADRTITQKMRQEIMADENLSTNAKNIKIITINGVTTLRGPVASPKEIEIIVAKIRNVPGSVQIENQLEVTHSNK